MNPDRDMLPLALSLLLSMLGSIAVSGIFSFFDSTAHGAGFHAYLGLPLNQALFLSFNVANILSRPLVPLLLDCLGRPPSGPALLSASLSRLLAGVLFFLLAFVPSMGAGRTMSDPEAPWAAWLAVVGVFAFGLVGGAIITLGFVLARDLSVDAEVTLHASRINVLFQNAGLTFGAGFSGAFAAAYDMQDHSGG